MKNRIFTLHTVPPRRWPPTGRRRSSGIPQARTAHNRRNSGCVEGLWLDQLHVQFDLDNVAEQIARYYVDLAGRASNITFVETTVNGRPGLVGQQDGMTQTVFAFAIADGRIKFIWAVRNPEKLRPWTAG